MIVNPYCQNNWKEQPPLSRSLIHAAIQGKIKEIISYLNQGGDVNAKCIHGFTLLYYAATTTLDSFNPPHVVQKVGNLSLVTLLIQKGAEDHNHLSSNKVINKFGSKELISQLNRAKVPLRVAIEAVKNEDSTTLEQYLSAGGWINMPDGEGHSLLDHAFINFSKNMIQFLITRKAKNYTQKTLKKNCEFVDLHSLVLKRGKSYSSLEEKLVFFLSLESRYIQLRALQDFRREMAQKGDLEELVRFEIVFYHLEGGLYRTLLSSIQKISLNAALAFYALQSHYPSLYLVENLSSFVTYQSLIFFIDKNKVETEMLPILFAIYNDDFISWLLILLKEKKYTFQQAFLLTVVLLKEPEEQRKGKIEDYCFYYGPNYLEPYFSKNFNELIGAAIQGNWFIIQDYLHCGGWIHMPDRYGRSILSYAIQNKQIELIKKLLACGAVDYNRSSHYLPSRELIIPKVPFEHLIHKKLTELSDNGVRIDYLFCIHFFKYRQQALITLRQEIAKSGDLYELILTEIVILAYQRGTNGIRFYSYLKGALENEYPTKQLTFLILLYYSISKNLIHFERQEDVFKFLNKLNHEEGRRNALKNNDICTLPSLDEKEIAQKLNALLFVKKIRMGQALHVLLALIKEQKMCAEIDLEEMIHYLGPCYFPFRHKCTLSGAIQGAIEGKWQRIQDYLDRGGWVNKPDRMGKSLLFYAMGYGQVTIVKKLIEAGAVDYNSTFYLIHIPVKKIPLQIVIEERLKSFKWDGAKIDFLCSLPRNRLTNNLKKTFGEKLLEKWDTRLSENTALFLSEIVLESNSKFIHNDSFPLYKALNTLIEEIPSPLLRFRVLIKLHFLLYHFSFRPFNGEMLIQKAAALRDFPSLPPNIPLLTENHTLFVSLIYGKIIDSLLSQDFASLEDFEVLFNDYIKGIEQFGWPLQIEFTSNFFGSMLPLIRWLSGEKLISETRLASAFYPRSGNKEKVINCLEKLANLLESKAIEHKNKSLGKLILQILRNSI